MLTHTVPDAAPLACDFLLVAALRERLPEGLRRGLPVCRVGIAGTDGRVYRVLVCSEPRERALLYAALHELGLAARPSQVGMTVFHETDDGALPSVAHRSTHAAALAAGLAPL